MALPQDREHLVTQFGQMGIAPLAPDQFTTEFEFKQFDRAGERWLGNIAFFCGAGEIESPSDRNKIANLLHFHWNLAPKPEGDKYDQLRQITLAVVWLYATT